MQFDGIMAAVAVADDDDDDDDDDVEHTKGIRGKGKEWTTLHTFNPISLQKERELLKSNFKCKYSSQKKYEYLCLNSACSCKIRMKLIQLSTSSLWQVSMTKEGHNHPIPEGTDTISLTSNEALWDDNQPKDDNGLTEDQINFLEFIIEDLGDPRTTALKRIRTIWHSKYEHYLKYGGEREVVPFPDEKRVKYRLTNRLRGLQKNVDNDKVLLAGKVKAKGGNAKKVIVSKAKLQAKSKVLKHKIK